MATTTMNGKTATTARTTGKTSRTSIASNRTLDLYDFEFVGVSSLLMHADNIEASDAAKKWQVDPKNAKISVRGDDRYPAWTWQAYLYVSEGKIVIPTRVIGPTLRKAAGAFKVPGGRSGKTFKDATQYGFSFDVDGFDLLIDGEPVPVNSITELWGINDFDRQKAAAVKLGFDLHMIRARVGQSKHVRVRPIFERWSVVGRFGVTEEAITHELLSEIMAYSGDRVGMGDWRPSAPSSPGPYGRFAATVTRVD